MCQVTMSKRWSERRRSRKSSLVAEGFSSNQSTCFRERSHEERRWLFEEPTQSRRSPSIRWYTNIKRGVCGGFKEVCAGVQKGCVRDFKGGVRGPGFGRGEQLRR